MSKLLAIIVVILLGALIYFGTGNRGGFGSDFTDLANRTLSANGVSGAHFSAGNISACPDGDRALAFSGVSRETPVTGIVCVDPFHGTAIVLFK